MASVRWITSTGRRYEISLVFRLRGIVIVKEARAPVTSQIVACVKAAIGVTQRTSD